MHIILGGYNSRLGIELWIKTLRAKTGLFSDFPYQEHRMFQADSGSMTKSLNIIRFGINCPGCSPSISLLSMLEGRENSLS